MLPMFATPAPDGRLPRAAGWGFEVKWDGMRVIAETRAGGLRLTSRRGNQVSAAYPELDASHLPEGLILDGEVVALAEGRPSFLALASRIHVRDERRARQLAASSPVTFMAFDLLRVGGVDLTSKPLRQRRELLEALDLTSGGPRWQLPPSYDDGELLLNVTRDQGLEGVVAKRWSSKYYPGRRSPDWLKLAHRSTLSCAIAGWTSQTDNARVLGAVWMAVPNGEGGWRTLGRCGAGLVGAAGAQVKELITAHPLDACPLEELPDDPDVRRTHWVEPRVLIDVRYLGSDDSGRLRQPVYRGLRDDLAADDLL